MKELFESWSRFLTLREERKTAETMQPGFVFRLSKKGRGFQLELLEKDEEGNISPVPSRNKATSTMIAQPSPIKCIKSLEIKWVNAPSGYGPLFYDIMMELSGKYGIHSDRVSVEKSAEHIWYAYENERDDVESSDPMDLVEDTYENDECIDIIQDMFADAEYEPTSRIFRRIDGKTPTIDKLEKAGRFI